jgi:steroid delta-isomerase-like uncharacterized protein
MSVDENVELIREWFREVWNKGNLDFAMEKLHPDVTGYGQGEQGQVIKGPEAYLEFVKRIRGAFPDLHLTVEDAFGAGDKVAVRWSATMTHTGGHLGVKETNRAVTTSGIAIVVVRDGKLVEGWDAWDQAALLEQIGVYRREPAAFVA